MKKSAVVMDAPLMYQRCTPGEMGLEDRDRARTELYPPILARLRHVARNATHTALGNRQNAVCAVVVAHDQRDFFRRSQSREEAERVVVRLRRTPVTAQGRDQGLRILHAEGIEVRPILLADASTAHHRSGIACLGVILETKRERPAQGGDEGFRVLNAEG
ncbi:MAG TPA: hypothetical protein VFS52_07420, partial [Steroidobacteraceae bacterium]|nr:hypothetical protein [Steroidobacteraceae bacterium]